MNNIIGQQYSSLITSSECQFLVHILYSMSSVINEVYLCINMQLSLVTSGH
jgi:hypothetical protein